MLFRNEYYFEVTWSRYIVYIVVVFKLLEFFQIFFPLLVSVSPVLVFVLMVCGVVTVVAVLVSVAMVVSASSLGGTLAARLAFAV